LRKSWGFKKVGFAKKNSLNKKEKRFQNLLRKAEATQEKGISGRNKRRGRDAISNSGGWKDHWAKLEKP